MPRTDYKSCKSCGGTTAEVGPLSHNCLCRDCAWTRATANNIEISVGAGPFFEHQQRRILLAARRRLLALEQAKG